MIKRICVALFAAILITACSDDDSAANNQNDNFDRSAVLVNWADNIIVPVYEDLNSKLQTLVDEKDAFVANPNLVNLQNMRSAWEEAYKVWQHAEMFNVGLAETSGYVFQMNVYPTNIGDIQNNIDTQDYDLSAVGNNDAVGFPALDYMLFGLADTDGEILDLYTISADAGKHRTYLNDLTDQMKLLTQTILNDWTGGFRDSFVTNTDNVPTGSLNVVVNDFIYYYEKGFRANKFGIPGGVFSSTPLPDRVEALYHGDFSKTLALEGMKAIQNFFNGKAYDSGSGGESLDDYLEFLNTIKGGDDLSALINDQFGEGEAKIKTLNESFEEQVKTNNVEMTETFDVIQLGTVLLKVDMLQALDISVDYVDADGD